MCLLHLRIFLAFYVGAGVQVDRDFSRRGGLDSAFDLSTRDNLFGAMTALDSRSSRNNVSRCMVGSVNY